MKTHFMKIVEYITYYWKWLLLPAYLFAVGMAWGKRDLLLGLLPIGKTFPLYFIYDKAVHLVLILIGAVGLYEVISIIRKPLIMGYLIERRFVKIGFRNSEGEYPVLLSRRKDTHKGHGVIYKFKNNGISISEFEGRVSQLCTALNGRVYQITPNKRNMRKTLVYVLPKKYDTPTIISENTDYLTRDLMNLLCVGKTGSGKSYSMMAILGSLVRFKPDVSITICDYKKSSFAQFEDTQNFYGYEDVPDGIARVYQEFSTRLEANDEQRNKAIRVLLIDEYGALISAQEKKRADELKTMVANMLFMGRSLGIIVIVGVQRADAEHFKAGARDQFHKILAMGNLSKEQEAMLFASYKDALTANNGLGEGYLLIDGKGVERVRVARINDTDTLNAAIRQAMNR